MTFNEIEKEFERRIDVSNYPMRTEVYRTHDIVAGTDTLLTEYSYPESQYEISGDKIKSFLKQSFIKYLQSEVERLGFAKQEEEIYVECPHAFDCGGCMNKIEKEAVVYNQAISDQITHLQAQIKELEK